MSARQVCQIAIWNVTVAAFLAGSVFAEDVELSRREKSSLGKRCREAIQLRADDNLGSDILSAKIARVFEVEEGVLGFTGTYSAKKLIRYSGLIKGEVFVEDGKVGDIDQLHFKSEYMDAYQEVEQKYLEEVN